MNTFEAFEHFYIIKMGQHTSVLTNWNLLNNSTVLASTNYVTRLISIVSTPISVVVVFVVIVVIGFVKYLLCPKNFDQKTIHDQKTLGQKC